MGLLFPITAPVPEALSSTSLGSSPSEDLVPEATATADTVNTTNDRTTDRDTPKAGI
eukprot:gene20835-15350_t